MVGLRYFFNKIKIKGLKMRKIKKEDEKKLKELFAIIRKTGKGKLVQCHNSKCLHFWIYRGKSSFYTTCSKCQYKVNIRKPLLFDLCERTKIKQKSK